jgi:hypothetical protein
VLAALQRIGWRVTRTTGWHRPHGEGWRRYRCALHDKEEPDGTLLLDDSVLAEKLVELRKSTKLPIQTKIRIRTEGDRGWADRVEKVQDTWEVVYGRVELALDFNMSKRGSRTLTGYGTPPIAAARIRAKVNPRWIAEPPSKMTPREWSLSARTPWSQIPRRPFTHNNPFQ